MNKFEYASPRTLDSAVKLLSQGAAVLAGGTDLISLMKEGSVTPQRLVDIKGIPELCGISKTADGLRIGALTSVAELLSSPVVAAEYPALVQAAEHVRSPQIQHRGTVGGDLCQRPRCWYFRRGFGLLAMKDGKSMVPQGDNRYHAILGNSGPAYFVNASSFAPALIAAGAKLGIVGPSGTRQVALAEFYRIPAREGELEYALAPNEIVTEVLVPLASGKKSSVYEVREKEALDWPLVAAAAVLDMDGENVRSASIVMGHVAPKPWPAEAAAKALVGKKISAETAGAAGNAAVDGAKPLSGNAYKVQLARVAVKRAVLRAAGMEVA